MALKSFSTKLTLWLSAAVVLIFSMMIANTVVQKIVVAQKHTQSELQMTSEKYALKVNELLNSGLQTSKYLEQTFISLKDGNNSLITRASANKILKNTLRKQVNFIGIGMIWEPQQFDGKDNLYTDSVGHDEGISPIGQKMKTATYCLPHL